MPDRLAELRRQRALIAEHLAWLDREISASAATTQSQGASAATVPSGKSPEPTPKPIAHKLPLDPAAILAAAQPSPAPTAVPPDADVHAYLLPEHQPTDVKQDVRRGCFLYFGLAALLVVVGCALLVWASQVYKERHPPKPRPTQIESP